MVVTMVMAVSGRVCGPCRLNCANPRKHVISYMTNNYYLGRRADTKLALEIPSLLGQPYSQEQHLVYDCDKQQSKHYTVSEIFDEGVPRQLYFRLF